MIDYKKCMHYDKETYNCKLIIDDDDDDGYRCIYYWERDAFKYDRLGMQCPKFEHYPLEDSKCCGTCHKFIYDVPSDYHIGLCCVHKRRVHVTKVCGHYEDVKG